METPAGDIAIDLFDHAIKLVPLVGTDLEATFYYLPEGVDWDYLDTVIVAYPAMNLRLTASKYSHNREIDISATLYKVVVAENGGERILYQSDLPEEESPSGVFGYEPQEAEVSFSLPLTGPLTVEIENWERTSRKVISQDELADPAVLPLPSYPAHYRVYGDFLGSDGRICKTEFRFEIGAADS